ncbi:PREDICTED: solute carrier family 13 member 1-like [Nanorana parkeri]|uniref:solute carrier family 13 member 1-like n=1 Tax=Nanorana parkeri TaxID=125878 RepID=UPI0008541F6B|nr:PREDICTED: solute carrier family 13 member 1-like [Nanorana parkeri]
MPAPDLPPLERPLPVWIPGLVCLHMAMSTLQQIWQQKDVVITFCLPLLLLPLPLVAQTKEAACAYVLLVTATYWISEAIPLGAAALVPAFMFPLFGILKSSEVASEYFKDIHLLLFGVVCLASSIQKWNLHKRIALWMVLSVGSQPGWLLLGFMSCTSLLSMWLSNTSTAAMVMPIVDAVLYQLNSASPEERALTNAKPNSAPNNEDTTKIDLASFPESNNILDNGTASTEENEEEPTFDSRRYSKQAKSGRFYRTKRDHMMCKAFSLGIAYSSTIGGMATLTGTSTNLIFIEQFETRYPGCQFVNFGSWIAFSFPIAFIILIFTWMWITWLFLGFSLKEMQCCRKSKSSTEDDSRKVLRQEYEKLGPLSYQEVVTLSIFLLMALSWFTRDPGFVPGWDSLFGLKGYKSDATSSILFGFLLFIIPGRKPSWLRCRSREKSRPSPSGESTPMITWKEFEECIPWHIVILVGGGFALAKGCEVSGLSTWVGHKMEPLSSLPVWVIVLVVCLLVTSVTEVASNPATITIFQPILCSLAEGIGVNPLLIIIPATISASCAFLLPVANPPNAIVFSYGHLTVPDMMKAGLGTNLISMLALCFGLYTWGIPMFDLNTFPDWASHNVSAVPSP